MSLLFGNKGQVRVSGHEAGVLVLSYSSTDMLRLLATRHSWRRIQRCVSPCSMQTNFLNKSLARVTLGAYWVGGASVW